MINGVQHDLKFIVGKPDQRDRRTVRAMLGEREIHRDHFTVDSAFSRQTFLDSVHAKWPGGCPDDNLYGLGVEIIAAADSESASGEPGAVEFRRITAAELASATYDVRFFIPGLLVAGQPQGIFGPKKALKTSFMLDGAISVASGRPFLGYFHVEQTARVAVFSGESGMATIQETCQRICRAAGLNLADLPIVFSDTLPQFGNVLHIDALESFLINDRIELLFIDPAYLAMLTAGNEGSLFAMGALLRSISEMCQRIGVTIVLLHHMKKSVADPYAPGDLDDASWAGFAEFCRGWLLINRREKYEPGSGLHKLWLSVGGSVGHSGLWGVDVFEGVYSGPGSRTWDVQVRRAEEIRNEVEDAKDAGKEAKKADQLERDRKAIIRAVGRLPDFQGTQSDIRAISGRNGQAFSIAFSELVQDGSLIPVEITKGNNRSYPGFKLSNGND